MLVEKLFYFSPSVKKNIKMGGKSSKKSKNVAVSEPRVPCFLCESRVIHIIVISDISSPLCYVSKKLFDKAMRELEREEGYIFRVTWQPLIISLKGETHLTAQKIYENPFTKYIIEEGRKEGIKWKGAHLEPTTKFNIQTLPNSGNAIDAFKLLQYAALKDVDGNKKLQHDVAEEIFKSVWCFGSKLDKLSLENIAETFVTSGKLSMNDREPIRDFLKPDQSKDKEIRDHVMYWFEQAYIMNMKLKKQEQLSGIKEPGIDPFIPFYEINGLLVPNEQLRVDDLERYKNMIKDAAAKTPVNYEGNKGPFIWENPPVQISR